MKRAAASAAGRLWVLVGMLLFACIPPAAGLELLSPENRALLYENTVTVSVDIGEERLERLEIVVDGNRSYPMPVVPQKGVYCKTVPLSLGQNRIDVKGYRQGERLLQESLSVYYSSPVEPDYRYPPEPYKQKYFHTDTKERRCAACHEMKSNEVAGVAFENVQESNCYLCHKALGERAHDHAPAVNWLCGSCHSGKTGAYNAEAAGESKYLYPDPIGDTCLGCHEKNKALWADKRYHHNPAEAGRCNRCHNPHSSSSEMFLRKPVWELCVGCHADKAKGMHIANISFVRTMHPTKGAPDPSRPGKMLSCISCHNPHASNKRYFLPDNRGEKIICTMCHKK